MNGCDFCEQVYDVEYFKDCVIVGFYLDDMLRKECKRTAKVKFCPACGRELTFKERRVPKDGRRNER